MLFIDANALETVLQPLELVEALRTKFREGCEMPVRHHHDILGDEGRDGTLLLMPAWQRSRFLGLKCVTVYPANPLKALPTIMGFYALMSAKTGELLAFMDARVLTAKRTAAASALAASYLARVDASHLLLLGTGALAPYLIQAHAAIRPISHVTIFGRSPSKVDNMIARLRDEPFRTAAADDLEEAVQSADIICSATTANEPLILGKWLKPGTHVDLVGAFKPDMRETDDDAIARSKVYVDSRVGTMHEAGDILIPLTKGVINEGHVIGDLFELCRGEKLGRTASEEITLFKSVGMALEDLAAAELVFQKYTGQQFN